MAAAALLPTSAQPGFFLIAFLDNATPTAKPPSAQFTGMMPNELSSWMNKQAAAESTNPELDFSSESADHSAQFTGMSPEQMSQWIIDQLDIPDLSLVSEENSEEMEIERQSIENLRTEEFISDIMFVLDQ
ncbi:hypothetical protein LPJ66_001230 [Kickxella alabastrina]|uniref:Uncharacterized protein n=1 Tax=Kickxella alabastrina TaxID=61397 RepID=A0ACC1IU61_9FUNG|nr:hypothetical protein LPJ66_001230 [Kickxella alabastrina]